MSYSISMSGHGDSPVGASCYYSLTPQGKSASFSGELEEVAQKSVAFIRQCQAEEAAAKAAAEAEPVAVAVVSEGNEEEAAESSEPAAS